MDKTFSSGLSYRNFSYFLDMYWYLVLLLNAFSEKKRREINSGWSKLFVEMLAKINRFSDFRKIS